MSKGSFAIALISIVFGLFFGAAVYEASSRNCPAGQSRLSEPTEARPSSDLGFTPMATFNKQLGPPVACRQTATPEDVLNFVISGLLGFVVAFFGLHFLWLLSHGFNKVIKS